MILTNLLKQLTYEMENKSLEIHRLQDQVPSLHKKIININSGN